MMKVLTLILSLSFCVAALSMSFKSISSHNEGEEVIRPTRALQTINNANDENQTIVKLIIARW